MIILTQSVSFSQDCLSSFCLPPLSPSKYASQLPLLCSLALYTVTWLFDFEDFLILKMADAVAVITCLLVFFQFLWSVFNTPWVLAWVRQRFARRPQPEPSPAQDGPSAPDLASDVDRIREGMENVEASLHQAEETMTDIRNLLRDLSRDQRRRQEDTLRRSAAALKAAGAALWPPSEGSSREDGPEGSGHSGPGGE
jgi:hypothetical protein